MLKKIIHIAIITLVLNSLILVAYAEKPYIKFDDGAAYYTFKDKKATSGIRYRTVGWTVSAKDWNGNAALHEHGTISDIEVTEKKVVGPYIYTSFKISREQVAQAMIDAGMSEWKDGQTMYLSGIFETYSVEPTTIKQNNVGAKYKYEKGILTEVEGN